MPLIPCPGDAIAYYSDVAKKFHASYQRDANRLERISIWKLFIDSHAQNARTAYDIGCGSGILACELAGRGMTTTGIDGAEGMIAIANEVAAQQGISNVRFLHQTFPASEPLPEADLVVMSSVIEYLPSVPESLAHSAALLHQGGTLIFSVSNRSSLSRKLVWLVHRVIGYPRYFGLIRHFMTVDSINATLAQAGFSLLQASYFGRADRINRLLSLFLPEKYSSNMIIVAARKL